MTMSTRNTGKTWSKADNFTLKVLAKGDTPTRVIGLKLGRSESAIYSQASKLGVNLKPTNQSPYGTKKG
jgi:hypothetical protein